MNGLRLVPTDTQQKLALANAAGELRDALEAFLPLAREQRDGLLRDRVSKDGITTGEQLLNDLLLKKAVQWNNRIEAAEQAIHNSRGGD